MSCESRIVELEVQVGDGVYADQSPSGFSARSKSTLFSFNFEMSVSGPSASPTLVSEPGIHRKLATAFFQEVLKNHKQDIVQVNSELFSRPALNSNGVKRLTNVAELTVKKSTLVPWFITLYGAAHVPGISVLAPEVDKELVYPDGGDGDDMDASPLRRPSEALEKPHKPSSQQTREASMGNAITAVAKLRSAEAFIETFIQTALWKNGFSYLGTHVQWRQVLDIWKHKIVAGQLEGLEYVDKNDKGQPLDRPFYKQNSDDVMLDWNQCTLASTDRTDKMCFGKVFPVAKKNHDPPREGPGAGPGDSPNGARLDKIASALLVLAQSRNSQTSSIVQVVFSSKVHTTEHVWVGQDMSKFQGTLAEIVRKAQEADEDNLVFERLEKGQEFRVHMDRHDTGSTYFSLKTAEKVDFCLLADPFMRSNKTMTFTVTKRDSPAGVM
jgi:hypothetical protein